MQFYFENGRPPPSEMKEQCMFRINHFFYGHMDGLQIQGNSYVIIIILSVLEIGLSVLISKSNLNETVFLE